MNKIAQYLNEHILGEVSAAKGLRRRFSQDASVLTITPELVMFPRATNDIRKAARFAWQLAEKGHVLGMTVRGSGSDRTGASIGKGIIINTSAHLDNILHVGLKERVAHVQPGVSIKTLNSTLQWHGLSLINYPTSSSYSTVGGAIANNALGQRGAFGDSVTKLEVILANGDLIETSRLSKRDLSKKKGLQTFEGEVYRKLDGVIEDNEELLVSMTKDNRLDGAGYNAIKNVKNRDGSFDLTPLFIGSQGTLGIISELVLKTDFYSKDETIIVGVAATSEVARDVVEAIQSLQPAILETYDGELFAQAAEIGKKYTIFSENPEDIKSASIIYVSFNDFSDRGQAHKLKKVSKLFTKNSIVQFNSQSVPAEDLTVLREVSSLLQANVSDTESLPPIVDGAYIPLERHEDFVSALRELATKVHLALPIKTNVLTGSIYVYPTVHLGEVSDKQKIFRLLNDYSALVEKSGGVFVSEAGEGRLKANAAWALLDEETVNLYEQIRLVFDPYGTLNPDVKQKNDIKHLVAALRSSYDLSDNIDRGASR